MGGDDLSVDLVRKVCAERVSVLLECHERRAVSYARMRWRSP